MKFDIEDMRFFAEKHRGKYCTSGPYWSTIIRFPLLFDEYEKAIARAEAAEARVADLEEIGQENERAIINAATLFSQAGIGDPDGTLIGIVKNTVKRITELEQTLLLLNGIVAEYDTEQVCHYCGARRKVMGMIEHKENCKFKLAEKRMEELNYALGDKYAIKFIQSDYNNPDSNNPDFNNH